MAQQGGLRPTEATANVLLGALSITACKDGEISRTFTTLKSILALTARSVKSLATALPLWPPRSALLGLKPITISLSGLNVRPNNKTARPFQAIPHDPSHRLALFANLVRHEFEKANLIENKRPLHLHATVASLERAKTHDNALGKPRAAWRDMGGGVDAREITRFFNYQRRPGLSTVVVRPRYGSIYLRRSPRPVSQVSSISKAVPISGARVGPPKPRRLSAAIQPTDKQRSYVWASNIPITTIHICETGTRAVRSNVLRRKASDYRRAEAHALDNAWKNPALVLDRHYRCLGMEFYDVALAKTQRSDFWELSENDNTTTCRWLSEATHWKIRRAPFSPANLHWHSYRKCQPLPKTKK